jgi:general secretion pathway protein D
MAPTGPRPWVVLAVLAFVLGSPSASAAQQATRLNYANADIRGVIRSLATMISLNVMITADVPDTRVSYSTASPVAHGDIGPILEAILEAEGLVLVDRGPVAQVVSLSSAPATGRVHSGRTLPDPQPVGLITQIVPLEHISPEEALAVLEQLAGPISRLEALPRSNGIMLTDHASNVARFLELVRQIDSQADGEAGRRTYVYRLKHATASELAMTLAQVYGLRLAQTTARPRVQSLSDRSLSSTLEGFRQSELDALSQRQSVSGQAASLPPTAGVAGSAGAADEPGPDERTTIVADLATNSLVIRTEPPNYPILRATIEELDVRPPQVLLEVQVAEVTLDEATQYGINWAFLTQNDAGTRESTARLGAQAYADSAISGVQDLVLRTVRLGEVDVRALIRALASDADVRLLSTPHVVALNNEEARILVGSQVPFTQSTRAGLDVVVDQVVQYRDVGVQLTMIPTINEDGFVTFRMLQEVSALTAQNVEAALGASVISTREAETSAVVRNGQTVVIGGLIDEADEVVESGVPILKDIPILGYLFKSRQTRRLRTELAIFVTPYVIMTDEDAASLYERVRGDMDACGRAPEHRRASGEATRGGWSLVGRSAAPHRPGAQGGGGRAVRPAPVPGVHGGALRPPPRPRARGRSTASSPSTSGPRDGCGWRWAEPSTPRCSTSSAWRWGSR